MTGIKISQNLGLICSFLWFLPLVAAFQTDPRDWPTLTAVSVVVSAVIILVLIVVLIQCGGCVGMEVSSESHPAAGTNKGQHYPSSVVTDANTQVLMSSHTLPGDDPYQPNNGGQGLPYSLNPTVPSAPGFTGYQSTPTAQPAPGWGQGGGPGQGYQSPGPGAHRPAMGSEPPPPSYNDSVRGSDALW
ncbi:serine/threonine-protein kinase PAK 4-like [Saccostrea echinata]|uniref:serine/threonine-protein kinase PAK 4-like n=1 Tax=Saccostrea echinata TaxID=191078 RepID=UPI002A837D94|nr:serine/threonine-protein kinase PAK 4-like [Saccostrea echinata]